jgi:signal transduction histidine kinase
LVYPVGSPAVVLGLLLKNRHRLQKPRILISYGFFYQAYRKDIWMFELVDVSNKIFLCSILVFFPDTIRLQVGMVWVGLYICLILLARPYINPHTDNLQILAQFEIYLVFLVCLTLLTESGRNYDATVDILVSVLLSALTLLVILMFVCYAVLYVRSKYYTRKRAQSLKELELEYSQKHHRTETSGSYPGENAPSNTDANNANSNNSDNNATNAAASGPINRTESGVDPTLAVEPALEQRRQTAVKDDLMQKSQMAQKKAAQQLEPEEGGE